MRLALLLVISWTISASTEGSTFPKARLDFTESSYTLSVQLLGGTEISGVSLERRASNHQTEYIARTFRGQTRMSARGIPVKDFIHRYEQLRKIHVSYTERLGNSAGACTQSIGISLHTGNEVTFSDHLCPDLMSDKEKDEFHSWYGSFTVGEN
jgi:hypothetical protein